MQLCDLFPDEAAARRWFEELRWSGGAVLPTLRGRGHPRSEDRKADALLVPGVPDIL